MNVPDEQISKWVARKYFMSIVSFVVRKNSENPSGSNEIANAQISIERNVIDNKRESGVGITVVNSYLVTRFELDLDQLTASRTTLIDVMTTNEYRLNRIVMRQGTNSIPGATMRWPCRCLYRSRFKVDYICFCITVIRAYLRQRYGLIKEIVGSIRCNDLA